MINKPYYLNPNIKKVNLVENYTPDQIQEYVKCSRDPIYFIEKYVKIISVDKGLIPLILRDYQKNIILSLWKNRNSILLAARQAAKTTTVASFLLWYAIFTSDKDIAILANKAATAREILSRITLALENLPFFLQPGVKALNKGSLEFGNNSKIFAAATSSDSIRGKACALIYMDEYAFVENAEDFFKSTFPTISSGNETKTIVSSTPNGMNHYYKLWKDAVEKRNNFVPLEITWNMVPGRDEKWKKEQIEILGEHGFRQEYGNEFLGSSNTLISGHALQSLTWEEPISKDTNWVILEEPKPESNYIISVDSSRGVENDYSVAIVIDITSYPHKIVCTYKNNELRPLLLSNVIVDLAKKYNDAYLLIERNTIGGVVAESCYYDLEYENLFTTQQGKRGQELTTSFKRSNKIGVEMTSSVKRIGTSILKTIIEERKLINLTEDIVSELYSFISKNNTWSAEAGKNDDFVMSLVLYSWAINQPFFKELTDSDLRNTLMSEGLDVSEEIFSFGGIDNGLNNDINSDNWIF
jgi:hypothetical protein